MVVFHLTIDNPHGLHLRPACRMILIIKNCDSNVKIKFSEEEIIVSKLSDLLKLGLQQGSKIILTVTGSDEDQTAQALVDCLKETKNDNANS